MHDLDSAPTGVRGPPRNATGTSAVTTHTRMFCSVGDMPTLTTTAVALAIGSIYASVRPYSCSATLIACRADMIGDDTAPPYVTPFA